MPRQILAKSIENTMKMILYKNLKCVHPSKYFFAVMSKYLEFVCAILIADLNKDYPECEYFLKLFFT